QAGRDLGITASDVVGTHEVNLRAGNDIAIAAGQHTQSQESFREVRKSGLFSGGGLGVTIGKQQQSTDTATSSNTAATSMVGSVSGDTYIQAGRRYQQTGSTVSSPQGDVNIRAQQVAIEAAQDGHSHDYHYKFEQKGLTVAVNAPVINAMQAAASAVKSVEKIGQSKDDRINALAAANTAWETYQSAGAMRQIAQDPKAAVSQDISVSITYGEQKSQSESHSRSTEAAASQLHAGGKVHITAQGADENSNINIIGSDIAGQGGTHLQADNAVNILAAEQTNTERSSNTSSGWNAGVAISYGQSGMGFGITAGGNHGKGTGNGDDTSYRNSHVGSTSSATTIQSAGATNIIGGQVTGQSVGIEAAELNIQSLQDTSRYDSRQKDMSAQVTVGYGASASGSYSQSKINADYAAVREQSGILAGDGGYQIKVEGNTDLQGGLITSSQAAEEAGKNSLSTGTLTASDIQNRANYDGESFGVSASGAINGGWDGKTVDKKGNATSALSKSVGLGADSESASSVTQSGINTANIGITDQAKQQALTGQTAEEAVAAIRTDATTDNYASQAGYLDNNFDSERVLKELNLQVEVTEQFQ
ncbi:hemagglutinin, partial [Lampropedia cohaerens]